MHKNTNVSASFLGIPISSSDVVKKQLYYKQSKGIDQDFHIPQSTGSFNNSNIVVLLNFEFTEQIFEIYYIGVLDILARIGGLSASILPILRILGPYFILAFLV